MQDLNDLQYFAQVVRHGGFSAASRATGEPKSKLSKRVAQLERDLGVRLIERSTRSIQVSEIGRDISPSARSSSRDSMRRRRSSPAPAMKFAGVCA